jgi:short-subunit dehydrogenase
MDPGQSKGLSAEKCAEKIISGINKKRKEILIGGNEVIMVYLRKYTPFLYHTLASKIKAT